MGLKMKNVNIMGVHQKEGLGQFGRGLAKNREEGVFEGGGGGGGLVIPRCTVWLNSGTCRNLR